MHQKDKIGDGGGNLVTFLPPSHRPASEPEPLGDAVQAVVMRLRKRLPRIKVQVVPVEEETDDHLR